MLIQIKKGRDSRPTLVCVRADGTRTWSRVHPFFPMHDVTHYAVETVLGFTQAFFGLVAAGWSLESFADPGARARMPAEALWAESIVGLFDLERGANRLWTADEFSEALSASLRKLGVTQFRALDHGDDDNNHDSQVSMDEGLVGVQLTVSDNDTDTDTSNTVELGSLIAFEDDGLEVTLATDELLFAVSVALAAIR